MCGVIVFGVYSAYGYIQDTRPFDTEIIVIVANPPKNDNKPDVLYTVDLTKYNVSILRIDHYCTNIRDIFRHMRLILDKQADMNNGGYAYVGYYMSNKNITTNFVYVKQK
jgi:hypothetical protein